MTLTPKKAAILRNWRKKGSVLVGEVYGHPNFEDGTDVITTEVINWDKEKNIVETQNTYYLLGEAQ